MYSCTADTYVNNLPHAALAIRRELVFIDSGIDTKESMFHHLDEQVELVVLKAGLDALEQIKAVLAHRHQLAAIHIMSHGSPAALMLGSHVLDAANLADHDALLRQLGDALSEHGEILLYGCEVGKGAIGAAFVSAFASAAGANVAASCTLTGANWLGGDWLLDCRSGHINTAPLHLNGFDNVMANVAGTISIDSSQANSTDYGIIFHDGAGGSTDIPGVVYDFNFTDPTLSAIGHVSVFSIPLNPPLTGLNTGLMYSTLDATATGATFKTDDQQNFKLTSFKIVDQVALNANWTLTGYDNGSAVAGASYNFTVAQVADFDAIITLPTTFQNIDEVRISVTGGISAGGLWTTLFNNFVVDNPVVPDITPPTLNTVVTNTALKIGGTSIVTFTFSEAVIGFSAASVNLAGGTLSALTTTDNTTYTATYTPAAGQTSAVNVLAVDMTTVHDTAGNAGIGTNNSNNFTVDTQAPVVSSVAVPGNATYLLGTPLDFTVNFDSTVTVSGGIPSIGVTLDTGGTVQAQYVSGSGGSALVFRYIVATGTADTNGVSLSGAVSLNGSTLRDAAGNDASLTLNTVGNSSAVLVNGLVPVFSSASVNGNVVLISYTDSTTLDAAHPPASGAFSVLAGGVAATVTGVAVDAAAKTVTLTLNSPVAIGQAVTVAYTDPTAGNDVNAVQNAAGNDAVSLSAQVVTNNTSASTVSSVSVPANSTYLQGQALDFTVNFNGPVTVVGAPTLGLTLDTGGAVQATYIGGSGTSALTFRYAVTTGTADANGVSLASGLVLNGATLRDAFGNDANLTLNSVASTTGVLVNGLAPVFSAASVNGSSLVISYTESTALDAVQIPATGAFSVLAGGVSTTVTAVTVDAVAKTVTLTLNTPVTAGQSVTVAYTDPSASNDANAVQNAAGNDAVSLSAQVVTNTTIAPPAINSVAVPANSTYLLGQTLDFTVNFSSNVNVTGAPTLGLTLDTGGTVQAVYISGSGTSALTFRYTVATGTADTNGISLAAAIALNGGTLRDTTNHDAALTLAAVGATTAVLVNGLVPVFNTATVTGTSLVISYTDSTTLDAAHPPAAGAFSVLAGGVSDNVTAVAVDAIAKTVTLTLNTAVTAGQTITVAYTDPTGANDANAVQNAAGNDAVSSGAHAVTNTTAVPPSVTPPPGGTTQTALPGGGSIVGTPFADNLTGLQGKDVFFPGGGNDTIDGGPSVDTVIVTGNRSQYSLVHETDGSFSVHSLTDNSVVTMKNVERLVFDNQTLALDVTPASAKIADLYLLALGRNPEEGGLGFYMDANAQGVTTAQMATAFVTSNEFTSHYGALNDSAYITQLYINAFGRAPDAGGLAYHLNELALHPGLNGRADVLANFVDSSEMAVKLVAQVDQGIALLVQ